MLAQLKDIVTTAFKALSVWLTRYWGDAAKALAMRAALVVFIAYVLASAASSFSVPLIMRSLGTIKLATQDRKPAAVTVSLSGQPNYHEIRKSIIERNLFNAEGEYPDESEQEAGDEANIKKDFDVDAPCVPSKLKLTLVGTIYMGEAGPSLATIKEQGYTEADIYKSGDYIIGNDGTQVVRVQRNKVILNNKGAKECLEIDLGPAGQAVFYGSESGKKPGTDPGSDGGPVLLQASWVEGELGDGFGKIIQSARLVPNTVDNRVNGFKIFAIQKGTLFDKIGLQNGDVITQVNETVLEAEQGFALYQSFLEDREISVRILRDGKTPQTLQVRIK